MAVKRFKPVTPGTRFRVGADYSDVTTNVPEKSLVVAHKKSGGRNNSGKMTMRYLGGGHKKSYRLIDFKRNKFDIPATVATIEYDPNRSARIALLVYADGEKRYMLAPEGLTVGQIVLSGAGSPPEVGNTLPLKNIPLGSIIYNIELNPGQGGIIARSAGTYAQLSARDGKYAIIKLPSGETRMILATCLATIGTASNSEKANEVLGKAGRKRWLGRRPRVRGVAMNPVDHPMGGGEGRSSGGHPRSRKGLLAKGYKTRDKKKTSDRYIIERRKK
ncbi:50S ribosomal protein L2 [Mucilaginibacter daejeonensis]|uniref:50S ribosomal protein L2 n=1 Tax=Mucilaginibacter daejeonensis TaxID=398049 RepID=UPI001D176CD6|nr:50S ribosomal protein L2 [Mucilaginibacter daejeonensis]UEG52724.1 50S ribosomal protein L2 [Mucilaginibacter daejeonensis]